MEPSTEETSVHPYLELLKERSLLGLALDEEHILALLAQYPPLSAAAGDVLANEGNKAEHLIIILDGKAELRSSQNRVKFGEILPGRSVNLHSLVRKLPYQYSVVASEDCRYVSLPWREFETLLGKNRELEVYLKSITSSPVIRRVAKEIDEIGCSSRFRVRLIGSMNQVVLQAQAWLARQDEIPEACFYLAEGSIHTFQSKENGTTVPLWEVPKGSWQFWNECTRRQKMPFSFRTLTEVRGFEISQKALSQIAQEFEEDFAKFNAWLSRAEHSRDDASDSDDTREDVESLLDLFPELKPDKKLFRKFPWIEQYNEMDCGPACMAMISKYFGNEIPVQYWRDQIQTNREGSSMFDLARAAEKNGFVCHGIAISALEDLESQLLPVIALRGYHFVVVYEITKKYVTIGDPASGIQKETHEEFLNKFEGAVLLLKPGAEFYEVAVPASSYGHYLPLFYGYGREITLVILCSAMIVGLSLFFPLLLQVILDEVLQRRDSRLLVSALCAGITIAFIKSFLGWVRSYYLAYITAKFDFRAASSFVRKAFSLPYSFYANRHLGDFTRRLVEMEKVRNFFTSTLVYSLIDLATIALYGFVLFAYSPKIALATILAAPVLCGISMFFSGKLTKAYSATFTARSDQESLIADLVKGISTIKTLGAEVASRWRYEEKLVTSLKAEYQFSLMGQGMVAAIDFYDQAARFCLVGLASYLALHKELSTGQVVALALVVNNVFDPFYHIAHSWASIQEVKVLLNRLNDVFLAPLEVSDKKARLTKTKFSGEIEFQNVWFRYGGESSEWILKDLSFKIEPGQNVAIVGESGSGKSTIASLIARIYEPQKGHILIDGRDYRDYDLNWLRRQVGYLHQESNLFHGSIAENIAYNTPQFSLSSVEHAARLADAEGFILKKNDGYNYVLTHGGMGLSGGEKQRIALARTIFAGASILLLDEATSALDGISERKMLDSLKNGFKNTTVLSIAHRYTTVKMSDFVLVIAGGRCAGFGTHEQLEADGGVYARLFGFKSGRKDAA